MSTQRILIVDRPTPSTENLAELLRGAGFEAAILDDVDDALATIRAGACDLVVTEIRTAGEAVITAARQNPKTLPVVLFEDFAGFGRGAESLRLEAFETLSRPVPDEQILSTIRRALERVRLEEENRRLREEVGERFQLGNLISSDARMRRIFATVEAVADSTASLLIQGESGTGKTMLARAVHEASARGEGPFVVVNCGAIPSALLESELFGHAKGAFTGAVRDREGKFEAADGGTLFLDEIGTASPELQVKLLRVLEEGRLERVGEARTRTVDVRLIAATNVELEVEVAAGRFRQDLYYRIHVVAIELPPLRERPGDIALLAERFLTLFAARYGRPMPRLGPEATAALVAHDWPGNVRELENTLERALLLARGSTLRPSDLWPEAAPRGAGPEAAPPPWGDLPLGPLREIMEVPERWFVLRALREHDGNRKATARALGINRTTLFNKMRKYQLADFPTKDKGDEAPSTAA